MTKRKAKFQLVKTMHDWTFRRHKHEIQVRLKKPVRAVDLWQGERVVQTWHLPTLPSNLSLYLAAGKSWCTALHGPPTEAACIKNDCVTIHSCASRGYYKQEVPGTVPTMYNYNTWSWGGVRASQSAIMWTYCTTAGGLLGPYCCSANNLKFCTCTYLVLVPVQVLVQLKNFLVLRTVLLRLQNSFIESWW